MRLAIIHGTEGNPSENWFPWLATVATDRGADVHVPQFPTPQHQEVEPWLEVFDREVGELGTDLVLVGHSLGAVFVLRLLERRPGSVRAAHLVSGFTGFLGQAHFDDLNAPFVAEPYDWQRIRAAAGRFTVWIGSDDPYVPQAEGKAVADGLHVPLIRVDGGGHLNASAGFTTFDALWAEVKADLG